MQWLTCAGGSGRSLRFDPRRADLVDGEVSLLDFESDLKVFAFELEWTRFFCTDNERVDETLCHQRRVRLRDYPISYLVPS